ncbi:MAG: GAF domain-containing protein [Bacilli bacterium]|nr:GAF domain-containing protein [Bacilli bacterium]
MFVKRTYSDNLDENYQILLEQLQALISHETDLIANLANASALLNQFLTDINWVGFYLNKNNELVLGPFQGLPACIRIPFGQGVCGTAAQKKETIVVPDVHQFPGHIACDPESKSEIVVPLLKNNQIIGVLDIDSPIYNRFSDNDKVYLEAFVKILVDKITI